MNEQQRAEEHLRVIRTLMERATIYRAISAPTALVGGLLATVTAAASVYLPHFRSGMRATSRHFLLWWLAILLITIAVNTIFVWKAARRRHEPLVSPSMKLALHALLPAIFAACVITIPMCLFERNEYLVSLIWTGFYGLALLATSHFSPKSLVRLGWAFLLTAFGFFLVSYVFPDTMLLPRPDEVRAALLMGATFGLYHLIYAACVWSQRSVDTTE